MLPLKDTRTTGGFPFMTVMLIAVTIYVYFQEISSPNIHSFISQYALIPSRVNFADWQTLMPFVTAIFLHGGLLHLASNMLFLWVFGDNVEHAWGLLYLPFYIIGGVIGNVAQYFFLPQSEIFILGASGAVATVLGAYLVYYPHHRVKTLIPIIIIFTIVNLPAWLLLVYWFVIQLFSGAAAVSNTTADIGGVAYFAHIGGFVAGLLLAALYRPKLPQSIEVPYQE